MNMRSSRGLSAAATSAVWKSRSRLATVPSPRPAPPSPLPRTILSRALYAAAARERTRDPAYGRGLQRLAGQVDVVDVLGAHDRHEDTSVRLTAQETLLDEPLQRLADRVRD